MLPVSFFVHCSLATVFLVVPEYVCAQDNSDDGNVFINPGAAGPAGNFVGNLAWPIYSVQTLQWATTLNSYDITLYQELPGARIPVVEIYSTKDGAGTKKYTWKVQTYDTSIVDSPTCFFWINSGSLENISSHYFNITERETTSSSSSSGPTTILSSSTSTTNIASTTITSASTTADSASTTAPASILPGDNGGPSDVLKVGLGVGVGDGIPLVLIAGVWVGMKAVKRRNAAVIEPAPVHYADREVPKAPYEYPQQQHQHPYELASFPPQSPRELE